MKEETQSTGQEQEKKMPNAEDIKTSAQAIDILMQAVSKGREEGIYSWEDLEVVIKAVKLGQTEVNKKMVEEQFKGKVFVGTGEEGKVEQVEDLSALMQKNPTELSFSGVEMDTAFICMTPFGQVSGQAGDFLVKISDDFYLPLNPSAEPVGEVTTPEMEVSSDEKSE